MSVGTAPMSTNLAGALCAMGAAVFFSINDMAIKFLSDGYALHQVVMIRSVVGLFFWAAVIMPFSGGLSSMRTRRLGMHILRGLCVVMANMTFFLGLAVLPLADAVAIFFVSPLIITIFSVIGSAWNSANASTNDVPMIGSPPMPIAVDCPIPAFVSASTTS